MEDQRKKLGLSQEDAAQKAGLAGRQVWQNITSGRKANVTLETLNKIAVALRCDPRDLLLVSKSRGEHRNEKAKKG
jgi:transcriptional regulator with XRE-family HTH domain